jgi:CDP-4-dehydro-6-deoxyglucose reductase
LNAVLIESHELAPQIRHFTFEVPEVREFYFIPGQFLSFNAVLNEKKITRAYSIASAPGGNRFEICLNIVEDGIFSPHLFRMQAGDDVEISAPLGYFVLRDPGRDAVFIATGTGISPFRSMLRSYLGQDDPHPITLVFGVRYERNILYRTEFETLAREHPNFQFWPTLSRPDANWTGRTGHVQTHLDEALGGRRDVDVYICGLKLMVDDVRAKLKGLGFERKQIIYEKYD